MKTYLGKLLLQMAIIWMVLSSCFPCCRRIKPKMQFPDITLEKPTSSEDLVPTYSEKWSAAYKQYFEIIGTYTPSIQSTENILKLGALSNIVNHLADIRESISPNLPLEKLHEKLQTVEDIQIKQQARILECTEQLKRAETQPVVQEENLFLQAQQELCTNISSLCSQLIEDLEEAQKNNVVTIN
jgi:hypothetical protein